MIKESQIERYSRQIILPEVGGKGQERLLNSKVLIVGCGGLGSPAAYYLAGAGIGKIGLVDKDNVELNNLQRQILHFTEDIGRAKTISAKEKLEKLNPDIKIETYQIKLSSENAFEVIDDYDVIIDGSDNFPTRYLINDACVMRKKVLIHAGILRMEGQITTIVPGETPCYRCIFPEPPPPGAVPNCQQAGIIGVVAGLIGVIQAAEAIKYLLGKGELLKGKLLHINVYNMSFRELKIYRDVECPVCGEEPKIKELIDYEEFCNLRR